MGWIRWKKDENNNGGRRLFLATRATTPQLCSTKRIKSLQWSPRWAKTPSNKKGGKNEKRRRKNQEKGLMVWAESIALCWTTQELLLLICHRGSCCFGLCCCRCWEGADAGSDVAAAAWWPGDWCCYTLKPEGDSYWCWLVSLRQPPSCSAAFSASLSSWMCQPPTPYQYLVSMAAPPSSNLWPHPFHSCFSGQSFKAALPLGPQMGHMCLALLLEEVREPSILDHSNKKESI